MPRGYISIVLHAHLPYIRHPEYSNYLEERWLFEAITECYIPILQKLIALSDEAIPFKINVVLSPTLLHMLRDDLLKERYIHHLMNLEKLAENEIKRNSGCRHLCYLAKFYKDRFSSIHQFWDRWEGDIVKPFSLLEERGNLEILTCGATHGLLPLLSVNPETVRAQIKIAVNSHISVFGRVPRGIWLPECGYYPGVDEILADCGLRFFILDTHCILRGKPKPRFSIYAPVYTPSGVAAFGRDPESSKQVWSAETGYPGDFWYRDFYRDIGFDLPIEELEPVAHPDGIRVYTGIKYYRITHREGLENKDFYHPSEARQRAAEHAGNFMFNRQQQIKYLSSKMDRIPLVVAPYDAELFGHWWFEGPDFLDFFFRKVHYDQNEIEPLTLSEYLIKYPTNQVVIPSGGSWGDKGYYEVWLNGSNAWIYRHLHEAGSKMIELAERFENADEIKTRALNQAARELLLAQSSDWAFMMTTGQAKEFAIKRVKVHIARFNRLYNEITDEAINEKWLSDLEYRDNIFPTINYKIYRRGK